MLWKKIDVDNLTTCAVKFGVAFSVPRSRRALRVPKGRSAPQARTLFASLSVPDHLRCNNQPERRTWRGRMTPHSIRSQLPVLPWPANKLLQHLSDLGTVRVHAHVMLTGHGFVTPA